MTDTVCALATPIGGAIAVIRASGPACRHTLASLAQKNFSQEPRCLLRAVLVYEQIHMDDALAVFFPAPASYTGEDMFELHCHGGYAVISAVLRALGKLGLRAADPGEFTRRAFLNGKINLIAAEAVMDLIRAEASASARAALRQMQGAFSERIERAEALLIGVLSGLNAAIDYPEELFDEVRAGLPAGLGEALVLLDSLIRDGENGRILREGFRIVLIGAPNAGKSSLLNALLEQNRAIVTQLPGTTRDLLEETLLLDGFPIRITDTAGLGAAKDEAEQEGMRRARAAAKDADAIFVLLDGSVPLTAECSALLAETSAYPRMILQTKCDLPPAWQPIALSLPDSEQALPISAHTGQGLSALRARILASVGPAGDAIVTNQRHIRAMRAARASILSAKTAADMDCAATDLRDALVALGGITGNAVDDAVIEAIFSQFCVGK